MRQEGQHCLRGGFPIRQAIQVQGTGRYFNRVRGYGNGSRGWGGINIVDPRSVVVSEHILAQHCVRLGCIPRIPQHGWWGCRRNLPRTRLADTLFLA